MSVFDWIQSLAFCAVISAAPVFLATGIGGQDDARFAEVERRSRRDLAQPGWDSRSLAACSGSVEGWVCDRMPFRQEFIRGRSALLGVLGMPLDPSIVVLGNDGWLFFGDGVDRSIEQYRGLARIDDTQLAALADYFRAIRGVAAGAGSSFFVVIAPDKHAIYPEHLPPHLARRGIGPADQLISSASDVDIVDLRETFQAAKSSTRLPLYYRDDSHWNEFGAYLAYRAVMERIPGTPAVEVSESDFRRSNNHRGGLGRLAGPWFDRDSENTFLRRDFFPGSVSVNELGSSDPIEIPAVDPVRIGIRRSASVAGTGVDREVVLIGDSFLNNASRYFNNTFKSITYQHYAEFGDLTVADLVRGRRPSAVVFQIVQRNLLLPPSRFIPPGTTAVAHSKMSGRDLVAAGRTFNGLDSARSDESDSVLVSSGFDPSFVLPQMPPMPSGATVIVELTLPGDRLVQLYYQTPDAPSFAEERSMRSALPAGRHRIEWRIDSPLSGVFRLDPGNAPGEYRVHLVEFRP